MSKDLQYKTIYKHGTSELIEKKSRFISNAKPVSNEKDAIKFINDLKSKYWNATHNVYAYKIGRNTQRFSDDGEPSGTAGLPSLEIIKKEELQDIVIVVTRYYGGIQLGAGGLIRTYARSAKEGINKAKVIKMKLCNIINMEIDYDLLGRVENTIINSNNYIKEIIYKENVKMTIYSYIGQTDEFIKRILDITQGKAIIKKNGLKYIASDKGKILKAIDT